MPGTKGFRYVYAPAQINKLLNKVQSTGRPDKLTFPYIRDTWLLKNKQYQEVISLLKDMEFLDSSSVPTKLYAEYQNPSVAKQALAKGIRNAYPELFKAYPNAQSLSKPELEGYFRQQTGKAGSVLGKILSTFLALCSKADFSGVGVAPEEPPLKHKREEGEKERIKIEPKIQLNIEIHIAPDTPDDKIKIIFENMKTYLLPNE